MIDPRTVEMIAAEYEARIQDLREKYNKLAEENKRLQDDRDELGREIRITTGLLNEMLVEHEKYHTKMLKLAKDTGQSILLSIQKNASLRGPKVI